MPALDLAVGKCVAVVVASSFFVLASHSVLSLAAGSLFAASLVAE